MNDLEFNAHKNLMRAGELFMYSVWLQKQMVDLLILKRNPEIISEFIDDYIAKDTIPKIMSVRRVKYWEMNFGSILKVFKDEFVTILEESEIKDLDIIYQIRNAIAHSYVSIAREYLLFHPSGGEKKENEIINTFGLVTSDLTTKPIILKLEFSKDERYLEIFSIIKRIDEICFKKISNILEIPHSRIR